MQKFYDGTEEQIKYRAGNGSDPVNYIVCNIVFSTLLKIQKL